MRERAGGRRRLARRREARHRRLATSARLRRTTRHAPGGTSPVGEFFAPAPNTSPAGEAPRHAPAGSESPDALRRRHRRLATFSPRRRTTRHAPDGTSPVGEFFAPMPNTSPAGEAPQHAPAGSESADALRRRHRRLATFSPRRRTPRHAPDGTPPVGDLLTRRRTPRHAPDGTPPVGDFLAPTPNTSPRAGRDTAGWRLPRAYAEHLAMRRGDTHSARFACTTADRQASRHPPPDPPILIDAVSSRHQRRAPPAPARPLARLPACPPARGPNQRSPSTPRRAKRSSRGLFGR